MIHGQRILITGATSGLGREMARQLAAAGNRIAITGRREAMLADTARLIAECSQGAGEALPLPGCVTDMECVRRHYDAIRAAWGGLDIAILNAGVGRYPKESESLAEQYRRTIEINVLGATNWLEVLIPDMVAAGRGLIAGISSPAGWRGLPDVGPYSASKAAFSTLLESTRLDLRDTGVSVVTVCPGFVKSEMTAHHDPRNMPGLLETEEGARRILRGIECRRRLVHFPKRLTWPLRHVVRHLPGALYDPLILRLGRVRKHD